MTGRAPKVLQHFQTLSACIVAFFYKKFSIRVLPAGFSQMADAYRRRVVYVRFPLTLHERHVRLFRACFYNRKVFRTPGLINKISLSTVKCEFTDET